MSAFIAIPVIADKVLGISRREAIRIMNSGAWGKRYKISKKNYCVKVDALDSWIEKHVLNTEFISSGALKKAS